MGTYQVLERQICRLIELSAWDLLAIAKQVASEVTLPGLSSVYLSKVTLKLNP